ncbi:MAG: M56 family metallopeptidase [Isosphaeraceae bacterium]
MNLTFDAGPALAFGIDLAGKTMALLTVAWLTHLLLGPRRVLLRSALWNGCVVGLLTLPIAVLAIPNRPWPVEVDLPNFGPSAAEEPTLPIVMEPGKLMHVTTLPEPPQVQEPPALPVPIGPMPPVPVRLDWGLAAMAAYGLGVMLMLARLALAWLALIRLRRRSVPVEDAAWLESLARWRDRIGYRGSIDLRTTTRPLAPLAFGWIRPTIVLPVDLIEPAKSSAIDAILLHELGHLQRNDYAWNFLLRLSEAIYWPLPLAWPMTRVVDGVRERACDAFCVYWMGNHSAEYGEILVDVASRLSKGPTGALGLSMARSHRLGGRLMDLSKTVGRATCRPRFEVRIAAVGAMLAAVILVGPLRQGIPAVSGAVMMTAVAPGPADDPPLPVADPAPQEAPAKEQGKAKNEGQERALEKGFGPLGEAVDEQYRVVVAPVRRGDYQEQVAAQCVLKERDSAWVVARDSGDVLELMVNLGDNVQKDQPMVRFRPASSDKAVTLTSPLTGIVARIDARVGPSNSQNRNLIEVTDSSEMIVSAQVHEAFVPKIRRGQAAMVEIIGFDEAFPAKVTLPPLAIDPSSKTGEVTLGVPNPDGKLVPGMSGEVRLLGRTYPGVLLVPEGVMYAGGVAMQNGRPTSVLLHRYRKGQEGEPARFEPIRVKVRGSYESEWAIDPGQGLNEGDLIVLSSMLYRSGKPTAGVMPSVLNGDKPRSLQVRQLTVEQVKLLREEGGGVGGFFGGTGGMGSGGMGGGGMGGGGFR